MNLQKNLKKIAKIVKKRWSKVDKKTKRAISFFGLGVLAVFILMLFFFGFQLIVEKQRLQSEINFRQAVGFTSQYPEDTSRNMEDMIELKEKGIERFFLSKVEIVEGYYIPTINLCLFDYGEPIYPFYVYETFSTLYYPENPPYEVALVSLLFLPKDNKDFNPSSSCYIKEVKDEGDWKEMEERFNFHKEQF